MTKFKPIVILTFLKNYNNYLIDLNVLYTNLNITTPLQDLFHHRFGHETKNKTR